MICPSHTRAKKQHTGCVRVCGSYVCSLMHERISLGAHQRRITPSTARRRRPHRLAGGRRPNRTIARARTHVGRECLCVSPADAHARNRINWLDNELMNELRDEWLLRQATAAAASACVMNHVCVCVSLF